MARKSQMHLPYSGGGTGGRLLAFLAFVVVLALVIRDPVGAAATAERIAAFGREVLDALVRFGQALSQ